ncbi:DUF3042 family protein [Lactococcus garvieae]|uniref:DUF3042 domain-containing protein n=1 Tax=Lactococcus garvieae DCC43 TaxID=1231377 RepID=K2PGW9_9LACT|nr:DUF3042 family protein [Lactococcus garvieae]EKF50620.1 hypothetical protein C426_2056 [Lactococcus garvieae DCC43]QPS70332.1 DUF3042 family protein [Lactococcus garvieae]
MNKFIKGYLIGKAIEITVAGTAMMVAKHKGLIDAEMRPNFKENHFTESQKRAKRKRLAR